ncbi:MAG: hypothetical protein KAT43_04585 [Nanoarchaeota archaeon]|nr:hypothetical protein [Nanoarchaeota archaeon]
MKVYCFGNEFVKEDSLAKQIAHEIQVKGFEFVKCIGPDELEIEAETLIIMDVIKDTKNVMLIDDVDQLKEHNTCSCHDFDLGYHLKLYKELGMLKKLYIIGLPMETDFSVDDMKRKIKEILLNLFPV